jgi:hypothetical protein
MYVRTRQGFGQVRTISGQLSGPLADADLERRIAEAIEGERRSNKLPVLLIDISVNPFPKNHGFFIDFKLMNNFAGQEDQMLTALTKVHNDLYNADPAYRKRADAEWDLRNKVRQAITGLSFQQIRPFLLDALLSPIFAASGGEPTLTSLTIVNAFVKKMLPSALNQRLEKSAVRFSHMTNIGSILQSTAVLYQNRDAAFNRQVEAARTRMRDAQRRREEQRKRQEQQRQQKIRQQKKLKPPPKRKMTLKDI